MLKEGPTGSWVVQATFSRCWGRWGWSILPRTFGCRWPWRGCGHQSQPSLWTHLSLQGVQIHHQTSVDLLQMVTSAQPHLPVGFQQLHWPLVPCLLLSKSVQLFTIDLPQLAVVRDCCVAQLMLLLEVCPQFFHFLFFQLEQLVLGPDPLQSKLQLGAQIGKFHLHCFYLRASLQGCLKLLKFIVLILDLSL